MHTIKMILEKHLQDFFSDELNEDFGGEYGHDANIGKFNMKMPWSQTLHERLKRTVGIVSLQKI